MITTSCVCRISPTMWAMTNPLPSTDTRLPSSIRFCPMCKRASGGVAFGCPGWGPESGSPGGTSGASPYSSNVNSEKFWFYFLFNLFFLRQILPCRCLISCKLASLIPCLESPLFCVEVAVFSQRVQHAVCGVC